MTDQPQKSPLDLSKLPPAPRALTPKVSSRIWVEPRIFRWLLGIALLVLVAAYLLGDATYQWMLTRNLVLNGTQISARIAQANGYTRGGMRQEPSSVVELAFDHNGRAYTVSGQLIGRTEYIIIGDDIPIRINPDNPQQWTYRTEPPLITHELAAPLLSLVPLAAIGGLLVFTRKSLIALWQVGTPAPAIIASVRSSAIAPARPVATCLIVDGEKRMTVSVNLAPEQRHLKAQDVLTVLYDKSGRAVSLAALDPSI